MDIIIKIMSLLILLVNLLCVSSLNLNTPLNIYKRVYNNEVIKVYEPKNMNKGDMDAIIFYSGANSLIPADIYSNFINTLNNYNFSVNVVTNDNIATKELLYETRNDYKSIIPLTHSSGYVSALNTINSQKNIKKAVFLDPVDNSDLLNINPLNFMKQVDKKFNYLDKVLVLNAEKSYKWSFFPKLEVPFIPGFSLNLEDFQKTNPDLILEKMNADNYGHSDILDSLWSDLMHGTVSKGHEDRSNENLVEYHKWLAEQIYNFVNNVEEKEEVLSSEIVYSDAAISYENEYPMN